MAIDFPNTPTLNESFSSGGSTWIWNGFFWKNKLDSWIRPDDWLVIPSVVAGDEKIVGLFGVYEFGGNWATVTSSNGFTVDWGDGFSSNYDGGTTAVRDIKWTDVSSSTFSSRGYRQVIITITPQIGQTLASVNLQVSPPSSQFTTTPWLDITAACPNATSLNLSGRFSNRMAMSQLERFTWIGPCVLTTCGNMFTQCSRLQSISLFNTSNVTNMSGMFSGCISLKSIPLFNTSNVTNMSGMFQSCVSLKSIPLFDTSKVTDMSNMFGGCQSLESIPLFDTSNVTTLLNFCVSTNIQEVPFLNTAKVITLQQAFSSANLTYVPDLNVRNVTTYTNIFLNPWALRRCDLIPRRSMSIAGAGNSIELNRFYGRLPSLIPRSLTNAVGNGTNVTFTTSVNHDYLPGIVVTTSGISPAGYNLTSAVITDCPTLNTFVVLSSAVETYASGGTVTPASATITLSNIPGRVDDDPTIATAKGWTVTG